MLIILSHNVNNAANYDVTHDFYRVYRPNVSRIQWLVIGRPVRYL